MVITYRGPLLPPGSSLKPPVLGSDLIRVPSQCSSTSTPSTLSVSLSVCLSVRQPVSVTLLHREHAISGIKPAEPNNMTNEMLRGVLLTGLLLY